MISREIFLRLVDQARSHDRKLVQQLRGSRDDEALELYPLKHLLGTK